MKKIIEQLPTEFLDWSVNWANRNIGTDTITSANFTCADAAVEISLISFTNPPGGAPFSTFWLQGGVAGNNYFIFASIVTSSGRKLQETIPFSCISNRII